MAMVGDYLSGFRVDIQNVALKKYPTFLWMTRLLCAMQTEINIIISNIFSFVLRLLKANFWNLNGSRVGEVLDLEELTVLYFHCPGNI